MKSEDIDEYIDKDIDPKKYGERKHVVKDDQDEEYDASAGDLENGSDYLDYDSYDPTEYDDDYDKK